MKTYQCLKCLYEWAPRKDRPRYCPKCKRHDWQEPRKSAPNHKLSAPKQTETDEVPTYSPVITLTRPGEDN